MEKSITWEFNTEVAKTFVSHAQQHIPNYDLVIDKSVDVCSYLLSPDDLVIDVGCATGRTLQRLELAGFTNLVGVDASQEMLDHCTTNAKLICSELFPKNDYNGIVCNWTLHFIKDKISYIQSMFDSLKEGGVLILSDKTSKDPLPLHFYHQYKRSKGVSDQAIKEKMNSVESVMFINDPLWYLSVLKQVGFKQVHIIDASWCFTSFLCIK